MDTKAEKMALFRYGLVAPLVLEPLPRGELLRRAREIAARQYEIPGSKRISLCPATLLKWAQHYRQGGFEALAAKPRQDRGQFRAITPQLAELIERLKRENPHRAGTTLLRELTLCSGSTSAPIGPATLYRFLRQRGLTTRQLLATPGRKKFEAEFSNQVWQSDMLFGPYVARPGGGRMQAFLFAVLDDASRLIPHAQFYDNQGMHSWTACVTPSPAEVCLPNFTWTTARCTAANSWLAWGLRSASSSLTHPLINLRDEERSRDFFRPRAIPGQSGSQARAHAGGVERAAGDLDRAGVSPHRACRLGHHSLGTLAAGYRARAATSSRHGSASPVLLPPGSLRAPRFHVHVAFPLLRSSSPSGRGNH